MRFKELVAEISPERLERYLAHADKHVSNRMDRMSQARQRLSKSYEIYHADRPAGSSQIVDRFEADSPEQARQYYEKFIQNYDSDVDFDLRLRKGTGIMEYAQVKKQHANRDGIDLEARSDDKNVSIYAYADGRELAHVHFDIQPYVSDVERKKIIVPYDLEVNEKYRGQGIAAIMYDYAKELGYEVQRSYEQTDAGAYFWDKNRGPGSKVWESVQAYHGTFQPTLTHFNALSHFGTLKAAEDRLKEKSRREKIKTPGRVYEVVLDINNPFIAKDFAGVHSPTHFVFDLRDRKLISQEELEAINRYVGKPKQAQLLIKKLRELGFDSIAYKNKYEDKGSTSYVILDPTQVVSVKPVEQPVNELFDQPVKHEPTNARTRQRFRTEVDGHEIQVHFTPKGDQLEVAFYVDGHGFAVDNIVKNPARVFSAAVKTIVDRLPAAVEYYKPTTVWYKAVSNDKSRVSLYKKLLSVFQRALGSGWSAESFNKGGWQFYKLTKNQTVNEARLPRAIEDFLYNLTPEDVGVDEVGPYRIHYEGFTDDCQSSADYRKNPEAVYQQVFADHIAREGGRKPVEQNFTGDEDYPILYSVFKVPRQVKEIARIPQSELGDWGEKGTLEPPKEPVKKKELPGGSGYTYAVNKTGTGNLEIMIFDGEKLAAELDLFETQDVLGTWGVETVVVERPYRGQGLGKALYGIALSILKLTLEAGQTQTKHGQQMWLMLNSIPGVEVMGYNMVPTSKYQAHQGDKIIAQDKEWTRYTFPVQPGKRSMRSGRPGTGLYTSQATMIAKWTGK